MLPLQLVEGWSFRKFMSRMDPMYVMPSLRTVTHKLTGEIDKLKMQRRKALKESMDGGNIRPIHSVMDLWSSRAMEPIAGIRF